MNTQPLLVQVLSGRAVSRPPVWLMRQAGRYMSEYRVLKETYSFLELCRTPELAVQVSLQPIDFLEVDAAIIFSDILLPLIPMGLEVDFAPGPVIANKLNSKEDVGKLKEVDAENDLQVVLAAIAQLRRELESREKDGRRPAVIGFCGAPWTLACYAIEQSPYKQFQRTEVLFNTERKMLEELLDKLSNVVAEYLVAQYKAGADVVQLFDTWAGNLSAQQFEICAAPYVSQILERLRKEGIPSIYYVNGSSPLVQQMVTLEPNVLSIDWRTPLAGTYDRLPPSMALQGNLNPTLLFGTEKEVRERALAMRAELPNEARYIANLGHGVLQTTPPKNVRAFVQALQGR